jgi:hypothetical protein
MNESQPTSALDHDIEMAQPNSANDHHYTSSSSPSFQENNDWDPVPDLPAGYPKLAEYFARISNAASFRRFRALSMRKLLGLHADLCVLEQKLLQIQKEDAACTGQNPRKFYATHWGIFKSSGDLKTDAGDDSKKQWELLMNEIDHKLERYCTRSPFPF